MYTILELAFWLKYYKRDKTSNTKYEISLDVPVIEDRS